MLNPAIFRKYPLTNMKYSWGSNGSISSSSGPPTPSSASLSYALFTSTASLSSTNSNTSHTPGKSFRFGSKIFTKILSTLFLSASQYGGSRFYSLFASDFSHSLSTEETSSFTTSSTASTSISTSSSSSKTSSNSSIKITNTTSNEVYPRKISSVLSSNRVLASAAYISKKGTKVGVYNGSDPFHQTESGEDAFFISTNLNIPCPNHDNSRIIAALGVADGVGGYARLGIDSSLMSWRLLQNVYTCLHDHQSQILCPRELLKEAFDTICFNNQVPAGGTTACVLLFRQEKEPLTMKTSLKLDSANLGDSGYLIIRNNRVVFRTKEQTHYFNAPYQLSIPPAGYSGAFQDDPLSADVNSVELIEGDIIVLATDGFFDNVFDNKTVELLNKRLDHELNWTKKGSLTKSGKSPQMPANHSKKELLTSGNLAENIVREFCRELAEFSHSVSRNKKIDTPFSKYASNHSYHYKGGKEDDITIVVATVSSQ